LPLRLDVTTASGDSAVWSPAGETILQLAAAKADAEVQVQARVNAAAPWVTVANLVADRTNPAEGFVRLPKMPFLRLSIARNTAGQFIKVWDNE
jgi:hypothetical protein